jgi:hypothetical protein
MEETQTKEEEKVKFTLSVRQQEPGGATWTVDGSERYMEKMSDDEMEASMLSWYAKRVVFAGVVSWSRGVEWERAPEEECATILSRVPKGTGLFTGCSEAKMGGVDYDAVIVLRSGLATIGDLNEWFEVVLGGPEAMFKELSREQNMEEYLFGVQEYCARGFGTYGTRLVVERGDAEMLATVGEAPVRRRYKSMDEMRLSDYVKRLVRLRSWHVMSDDDKVLVRAELRAVYGPQYSWRLKAKYRIE